MRTTVDIPEPLLRQARARAALDGLRMKDVVNLALSQFLGLALGDVDDGNSKRLPKQVQRKRIGDFQIPVIHSKSPGSARITPQMLKDAENADEDRKHEGLAGR